MTGNLRLDSTAFYCEDGPVTDADERQRLAALIKQRRRKQGLSLSAAAEAAGIDRATWTSAETGRRKTYEHLYAAIERALLWAPGSIETVLAGGDPLPVADPTAAELARIDHAVDMIYQSPIEAGEKLEAIMALDRRRREILRSRPAEPIHDGSTAERPGRAG